MIRNACRTTFRNNEGLVLCGHLELPPEGEPRAWAIFCHCFTCNKNYKAPVHISRFLAAEGIATLRFDFPGLGGSQGDFSDTTLTGYVKDVRSAGDYLKRDYGAPRLLIGHSMGGAAVLLAAAGMPGIELVVTLAAPSKPGEMGYRLKRAKEQAIERGIGELEINGKKYLLRRDFFDDVARHDLKQALNSMQAKLLVVHSPSDDTVPFDSAKELMAWAHAPKSLLELDEAADHLFSREEDAEKVARAIAIRLRR